MTVAIPTTAAGTVSTHFGHCEEFTLFEIKDGTIAAQRKLTPPPHEPGVLPKWLHQQGADVIITGGMGQRARDLFEQFSIKTVVGISGGSPEDVVQEYLKGTLESSGNLCDH